MATEKKITKREMFTAIRGLSEVQSNPDMVAFIDHEIELLDKKSSTKSKADIAKEEKNEAIYADILSVMEVGKMYRVSELMKIVPSLDDTSNQFASRRMMEMETRGMVTKVTEKRVTYYTVKV